MKELGGEGTTGYRLAENSPFDWRSLTKAEKDGTSIVPVDQRLIAIGDLSSPAPRSICRRRFRHGVSNTSLWKTGLLPQVLGDVSTTAPGMKRLRRANRTYSSGTGVGYVRYLDDYPTMPYSNIWSGHCRSVTIRW